MRTEYAQGRWMPTDLRGAWKPLPGFLLIFFLIVAAPWPASAADQRDAPDFALPGTGGNTLRLSEFRGDVVLLATWAGWCQRCTEQLAQLARLEAAHPAGLKVLVLSLDPDEGRAAEAAHRHGLTFLHDADGTAGRLYAPRRLPALWLVDPHGHIQASYTGGDEAWYDDATRLAARHLVPSASELVTVHR